MDFSDLTGPFTEALIVLIMGALAYVSHSLRSWTEKKKKERARLTWTSTLSAHSAINYALSQFRDQFKCMRTLVLVAQDSGSIPKPDKQLYVTIKHESTSYGVRQIINAWQRRPVDSEYNKVLAKAVESPSSSTTVITAELEESHLKDSYERDGISWSYIFTIDVSDTKIYYASLAFSGDSETSPEDPDFLDEVRNLKEKLKMLLEFE